MRQILFVQGAGARVSHSPVRRTMWVAVALATICVGLGVHELGFGLLASVRDVVGDALWALMMFAWIGALWPQGLLRTRAGFALLICWTVEISQSYHTPWLDALRRTAVGQLVLGSGFNVRDLGSYALGVLVGCAFEVSVRRRPRESSS